MSPIRLDPDEQARLEALLESSDPQVRRRARIVLTYHTGAPTRVVAAEVGLSRPQTRHYRQLFEAQRMGMFDLTAPSNLPHLAAQNGGEKEKSPHLATQDGGDQSRGAATLRPQGEDATEPEFPAEPGAALPRGAGEREEIETLPSESAEEQDARRAAKKVLKRARKIARRAAEAAEATAQTSRGAAPLRPQGEDATEPEFPAEPGAAFPRGAGEQGESEEDQSQVRLLPSTDGAEGEDEEHEMLPSPMLSSLSTWEGSGSGAEQPTAETEEERDARRAAKKVLKRARKQARRVAEAAEATAQTSRGAVALRPQDEPPTEPDLLAEPGEAFPRGAGEREEAEATPSNLPHLAAQNGGDQSIPPLAAQNGEDISQPLLVVLTAPGLLPDDTLAEAGRKTLLFHFAEMLRNEEGTLLGEDIEALHDMRVATRRMRAALDIFGPAYKPKTVKKHLQGLRLAGRALGRVRDLDVFIEKAEGYALSLEPAQRPSLDPLLNSWRSEREQDRFELIAHLSSKAHTRFIQEFNRFVQTPGLGVLLPSPQTLATTLPAATLVCHVAPTLIYTRLAAVRAFDAILPSASVPQLHLLRIEFKKLRYTLEFFQEVLGPEARPVINAIKKIQDHLGNLQDAEVAIGRLRAFLDDWDERQLSLSLGERQSPAAIVTYLAERHTERHRLITTFPPVWQSFNSPELQHSLAMAVSIL